MTDLLSNVATLVKTKRNEKKYSIHDLASILNVSAGLIHNLEHSKSDTFNLDLLYKLCTALDIPVTDLISYNINTVSDAITGISTTTSLNNGAHDLISSLITLSNNPNCTPDKLDVIIKTLSNEISSYNKLLS